MSFRFRRSLKLFPGVRINLGKQGASVSIGPRGAKTTIGPTGIRQTVGIPGTGLSYTTTTASSVRKPKTGLDQLTTVQLREILRSKNLHVSGCKADLISRIYENFTPQELGPQFAKPTTHTNEEIQMPPVPPISEEQCRINQRNNAIGCLGILAIIIAIIYFISK